MSNVRTYPWLKRNDYEAIKRLVGKNSNLPDTFDEWLERETERIEHLKTVGEIAKKVEVNSEDFAAWCTASGTNCNDYTLGAVAVVLDSMKGHHSARRFGHGRN